MANQSKLTLDDNLWPSLPKNFFKDCLLSASPQDAIKWLPVSNEIKAFMEANRDKMRRFRNCNFFIAVKNQQDIALRYDCARLHRRRVFVEHSELPLVPDAPLLDFLRVSRGGVGNFSVRDEYYRLADASAATLERLLQRVYYWFEIHFVTLEMGSTTVDILRPLVKKDVYFTLERRGWVGSTSIAAFLRLGIRNIAGWTERAKHLVHKMELDKVHMNFIKGHIFDHPSIERLFLSFPLEQKVLTNVHFAHYQEFENNFVLPWFEGKRPRLKSMQFLGRGDFTLKDRFKPVDVERAVKEMQQNNSQMTTYFLADCSGQHLMKVTISLRASYLFYPNQTSSSSDIFVEILHRKLFNQH